MRADGCLGGALPSPGMPELRAEKGGEAVALELDGEVYLDQGVKAGSLDLGADPQEAVKKWLHLPRTIPTALLRLSLMDGGPAVPALVEKVASAKTRLMHSLNVSEDPVVRAVITADLWGRDARNLARHFQLEDFSHDAARAWKSQLRRKHKDDWSRSWHGSGAQAFFDDPGANRLMQSADVSGRLPLDLLRLRAQTCIIIIIDKRINQPFEFC